MTDNQWWQTETNDEVATKRELWEPLSDAIGGFDLEALRHGETLTVPVDERQSIHIYPPEQVQDNE